MLKGLTPTQSGLKKGLSSGTNGIFGGLGEVNPVTNYDKDAWKYICQLQDVAKVTIPQQWKTAINHFYVRLKELGIYDKLDIFYLIIGGTAAAHSIEGKNPGGAFDITWSGANIVHNALGVRATTGTSNFGSTNWNTSTDSVNFTQNDCGSYCYVNLIVTNSVAILGVQNTINGTALFPSYTTGGTGIVTYTQAVISTSLTVANVNGGFFSGVRKNSSTNELYKNGVQANSFTTASTALVSRPMYVLARNANGTPSGSLSRACFFAFGAGIPNQKAFEVEVENLQVVLGRQALKG